MKNLRTIPTSRKNDTTYIQLRTKIICKHRITKENIKKLWEKQIHRKLRVFVNEYWTNENSYIGFEILVT